MCRPTRDLVLFSSRIIFSCRFRVENCGADANNPFLPALNDVGDRFPYLWASSNQLSLMVMLHSR